jgi:glutathione S-transferase
MLTVHHLGISQSERIVWLCEELEIPYELKLYKRAPLMAPPDYKALHPLGTAPIITDGTLTMAESGAIVEYIVHTYGGGRLIPRPGTPSWVDYLFWFHFANGSFLPTVARGMFMKFAEVNVDHPLMLAVARRREALLDMVEKRLGEAEYFAGAELTAADIMSVFSFTTGQHFMPLDLSQRPAITRYLQRVKARPAYQRAMAKAEPALLP